MSPVASNGQVSGGSFDCTTRRPLPKEWLRSDKERCASAGATFPAVRALPFGCPFGVAKPSRLVERQVIARRRRWPQSESGLMLLDEQFPLMPSAAALAAGIFSQAVLLNLARMLNRPFSDGS